MKSDLGYYVDEGFTKHELQIFRGLNEVPPTSFTKFQDQPEPLSGAVMDLKGRDKRVAQITRLAIKISKKYTEGLTDEPGERDWVKQANCLDEDTKVFYPHNGRDYEARLTICEQCPVKLECLDYALKHKDINGIWGGSSGIERRELLKDIKNQKIPKPEIIDYVNKLAEFE